MLVLLGSAVLPAAGAPLSALMAEHLWILLGSSLLPMAHGKALGFDLKQLVPDSAGVSCTTRQISWSNLGAGGNTGCWVAFFVPFLSLVAFFYELS